MAKSTITQAQIDAFRAKTADLCNRGEFKAVYELSRANARKHPQVLLFAFMEAVFLAEDTSGLPRREADRLYRMAAGKLRKLLPRLRSESAETRRRLRNEYYWFSKQPYKQYRLGVEMGKVGYYSAGVGAAQLARAYGNQGRVGLCRKWAKISEKAWLNFFTKMNANWSNSYMFYAMALAYQGRADEMERALDRCAMLAKRPKSWLPLRELRADIARTVAKIAPTSS